MAARVPGGLRTFLATRRPGLHTARAVLHIAEICLIVASFILIGLTDTHAVFAVCPLIIAALSGRASGWGLRAGWRSVRGSPASR